MNKEHLSAKELPTIGEENVGEARAHFAEQTLDEMSKVIKQLPSLSPEVKSVRIGLRRSNAGWKQDAAMSN